MAAGESSRPELGSTGYELFLAALSVLSLVNIVLLALVPAQDTQNVVRSIDVLLSIVFLIDFLIRLRRAPSRSGYFFRHFGWADLLASLPFPQVKVLRVFRLVRVIRLLREYGGPRIVRSLLRDRAGSALLTLLFVGILVLQFGSMAMLGVERSAPDANITSASDALWYVIASMSTVGYGDQYPVTNAGRAIGTGIIVVGVGIFGTLTGYLANLFLAPGRQEVPAPTTSDAQQQVQQLEELVAQQQAALHRLAQSLPRD